MLFYHKRQFPNRGKLPGVAFVVLAMSPLWVTTALRRPTLLLSNLVVNSDYIKSNLKCGCYFDRQIEQMKATIPIHSQANVSGNLMLSTEFLIFITPILKSLVVPVI